MKNKILACRLALITCTLCLGMISSANAEIARARAEYLYGPGTTENDACELALSKAKTKALASVLGESVSAEELLSCRQTSGKLADYGCELNQVTWTQIDGDIKKTISEKTQKESREGATACVAEIEVDVDIPSKKPDPNFFVRADFKQTIFRVGDNFNLDIEFSDAGHYAVFNWLPHDSNAVIRVIPTPDDTNLSSVSIGKDKSKNLKTTYQMVAGWSDSYGTKRKFYDEYLLVIATKKPQKWLSQYSLDDFKRMIREIPNDERRLVKKAYQITKN